METVEQKVQAFYMKMLRFHSIDFIRVKNQGFKGKSASYKSFGVWDEGVPCDKYFCDVMFFFNNKVYGREFGTPKSHKDRKFKQAERLYHMKTKGGVDTLTVDSMEIAHKDWQVILGTEK